LKTTLVLVGLSFIPAETFAFGFDVTKEYWVEVDLMDIYLILGLDVVLLFVFMYLKRVLDHLLDEIVPARIRSKKRKPKRITLRRILTSRATIAEESDILLDHEYDGIRELDNNLPPWWKWGFYLSILFAFVYMGYYHVFNIGNTLIEDYEIEMAIAKEVRQRWLEDQAMNVDETSLRVDKKNHWIHVYSAGDITLKHLHRRRGLSLGGQHETAAARNL